MERPPGCDAVDLLAPLPHGIARRRLNFNDIRAEVGEQPRAERRGDEMADLKNAQARQGAVRSSFGHVLIHARPSYGDRSPSGRWMDGDPQRSTWIQNQRTFATFLRRFVRREALPQPVDD